MSKRRRPLVEILYFTGCRNHEPAVALVEQIDRELGTGAEIRLVNVPDQEAANRLRFLGSPTIRVDGVDVDPLTAQRSDYALSCRIFTTERGPAGQPEERWIRKALATAARAESGAIKCTLEAAASPTNRCGKDRIAGLTRNERALYRWIIERFAFATPPSAVQIVEQAQTLALDTSTALAVLAREDLVHTDADGAVSVAYPFSARARGHEVAIQDRVVQAMCAIDALGIAAMLDQPIEIRSHDPISGGAIRVRAHRDGVTHSQPETAVVLVGYGSCEGPSYDSSCNVLNFFESTENAQRYLRKNASVTGKPISISEAAALGRAIFGDSLEGP
jgi:alkylmercury lyase-like protein